MGGVVAERRSVPAFGFPASGHEAPATGRDATPGQGILPFYVAAAFAVDVAGTVVPLPACLPSPGGSTLGYNSDR
jgi:hypothetical protein